MLTLKNEFVGNETRLQLLYIFFLNYSETDLLWDVWRAL